MEGIPRRHLLRHHPSKDGPRRRERKPVRRHGANALWR